MEFKGSNIRLIGTICLWNGGWKAYITLPKGHPDHQFNLQQIQAIYCSFNRITVWENGNLGFVTGEETEFNSLRYNFEPDSAELQKPYLPLHFVEGQLKLLAHMVSVRWDNYQRVELVNENLLLNVSPQTRIPTGIYCDNK